MYLNTVFKNTLKIILKYYSLIVWRKDNWKCTQLLLKCWEQMILGLASEGMTLRVEWMICECCVLGRTIWSWCPRVDCSVRDEEEQRKTFTNSSHERIGVTHGPQNTHHVQTLVHTNHTPIGTHSHTHMVRQTHARMVRQMRSHTHTRSWCFAFAGDEFQSAFLQR